jgi:hypothetical protein
MNAPESRQWKHWNSTGGTVSSALHAGIILSLHPPSPLPPQPGTNSPDGDYFVHSPAKYFF